MSAFLSPLFNIPGNNNKELAMSDRFAFVEEDDLNKLLLEKDSIHTRKNTASSVKLFRSYLRAKGENEQFETFISDTLNKV